MDYFDIAAHLSSTPLATITDVAMAVEVLCAHLLDIKILWFSNGIPYLKINHWYRCITDAEAEVVIAQLVPDGVLEQLPSRALTECLNRMRRHRQLQLDLEGAFRKHQFEVNLLNGVFIIKEQRLREHSPDDIFDYIVNFSYVRNASIEKAPAFKSFVDKSLQGKNLDCLLRSTGYCASSLTQGRVAILLIGKGGTGKSTFLNFFAAMFAPELISTVRFSDMARETYKPSYIGKKVNISRETDQTQMRNEDGFKSLISCEDTSGRMLYKNVQTIHSRVKFIFASNNDLVFAHPDDAVYDRLVVIRFTRPLSEKEKDPDLEAAMIGEKDIIMSMALDTLKGLIASGYDFKMSDDGIKYIEEKRAQLHTSESFFEACLTPDPSGSISHVALLETYQGWCKQNGCDAIKRNSFYDAVRTYFPEVRDTKVKGLHSFAGISFRNQTNNPEAHKEA